MVAFGSKIEQHRSMEAMFRLLREREPASALGLSEPFTAHQLTQLIGHLTGYWDS
jgi:hypothetical protein